MATLRSRGSASRSRTRKVKQGGSSRLDYEASKHHATRHTSPGVFTYTEAHFVGITSKTSALDVFVACRESHDVAVAAKVFQRTFAGPNSNLETYFNFLHSR